MFFYWVLSTCMALPIPVGGRPAAEAVSQDGNRGRGSSLLVTEKNQRKPGKFRSDSRYTPDGQRHEGPELFSK